MAKKNKKSSEAAVQIICGIILFVIPGWAHLGEAGTIFFQAGGLLIGGFGLIKLALGG